MSGIEVVAAVSAVVSAFHAGAELLKHIKAKRRKTRQAQQEFEEKQLQESLVSGEQQIGIRYAQDMRQFGDLVRVGDVIARDRLLHITILMQGEVIKSLQMAAQYENAIINLTLLHEASITNRRDTFVTLDELKQRLLMRQPINRQLDGLPEPLSNHSPVAAVKTVGTSAFNPTSLIPDNYIPAAVTMGDAKEKHALSSYFRLKRNSSTSSTSTSNRASTPADINFSEALQHLVNARGSEDRAVIMKDIDEIIDSYQGLNMSPRSSDLWGTYHHGVGYESRRDTLAMLNEGDAYPRDPLSPTPSQTQVPRTMPPSPEEYRGESPTFNPNIFAPQTQQQLHTQQYPARNPFPQMQTQDTRPRWSATSSAYSEAPSLNRNSSTSSQDSQAHTPPLPLKHASRTTSSSQPAVPLPDASYQRQDQHHMPPSSPQNLYAPPGERFTSPIAPVSHQPPSYPLPQPPTPSDAETVPLMFSPYAPPYQQPLPYASAPITQPQQQPVSFQDRGVGGFRPVAARHQPLPPLPRDASTIHSNPSERTITQPVFPNATAGAAAPVMTKFRHASLTPSIASTTSSGSLQIGILPGRRSSKPIRSDTIQSGPAGSEKMMEGRPCKANNYWGFCKGAWTTREDVKKGLKLWNQPQGLYNTREVWQCCECTFTGSTFSATHPTKKNKQVTIIDPRISTSESGVRYTWIFLAKSHVKKKATDHSNDNNFGCVICSVEGHVSSVYGGVETLMNHIAMSHVGDMNEATRKKVKCIIGREAGPSDADWELNIPVFSRIEELAA